MRAAIFKLVVLPSCDLTDLIASTYEAMGRSVGESFKPTDTDTSRLRKALDSITGSADSHLSFTGLFACEEGDLAELVNTSTPLTVSCIQVQEGAVMGLLSGPLSEWQGVYQQDSEFWQLVRGQFRAVGIV